VGKLILIIDIDDDIGKKAKLSTPIVGEKQCTEAGLKLALADPEDPDANVIFKGVKIYKNLKRKEKDVEIAIVAGHKDLGIKATKRISEQIDTLIETLKIDSVILVSDGVSDESVLPIVESRLKVEATEIVYVKQAKELEKAYFLFIEKLKDPYYSKFIFGIPAILILSISFISLFNIPWQFFAFLFGIYLLFRGFGIDEKIKDFIEIKIEGSSSLFVSSLVFMFLFLAIFSSFSVFEKKIKDGKLIAYASAADNLITFVSFLFFSAVIIKILRAYLKSNAFHIFNSLLSLFSLIAIFAIIKIFLQWIINEEPPFISFSDALKYIFLILALFYIISFYFNLLKKNFLANMDINNMTAYNSSGELLGIVKGKDDEKIVIKTNFGKKILINYDDIIDINQDNIVVKA
jgi:putative membrane protein